MDKAYIVSGVLFGDEGKGTVTDYLASEHNCKYNVRYNGGSQASHTVNDGIITHKFSQLGSSFLNENVNTYLSENTIVNLFSLYTEAGVFSKKTGISIKNILNRIYINKNALLVTPYHSLTNKIRELSSFERRGSVGSGVSEVINILEETGLVIRVRDLYENPDKILELADYTRKFVLERLPNIEKSKLRVLDINNLYNLIDPMNRDYIKGSYEELIREFDFNLVDSFEEIYTSGNVVLEGSQGLLIDRKYGIRPNTTLLDTSNLYGEKILSNIEIDTTKVGCIAAYNSRHGAGILTTRDKTLQNYIFDENQKTSYFQGHPIYGWMDTLLVRYSSQICDYDYLFMTQLDRLGGLKTLKICDSYLYLGDIDEEFDELFEYYKDNGKVIITDIKKVSDNVRYYLSKCIPIYISLKGFNLDKCYSSYEELPDEALSYIEMIEKLSNKKINNISIGSERSMKLERKKK